MKNKEKLVVADTGPLISWARAGQLPLLKSLLPALIVPGAVREELRHPGRPGGDLLLDGLWLDGYELPPSALLSSFPPVLGMGEKQAISLAVHLKADYILLDDGRAVLEAKRRGLEVLRSLRLLAQAKQRGLVTAVAPIVEELVKTGFWLDATTLRAFLTSVGESRKA